MATDSAADLERKLAKYRGQLAQLDALLASDSSNAELSKLRGDLQTAIKLTEPLLQQRRLAEAAAAAESASGWSNQTTNVGASTNNSVAGGIKLSLTAGAQPSTNRGRYKEGTKVEGPVPTADGRTLYYPGTVSLNHGAGTATVRFIGVPGGGAWADGVVMDESTLRLLTLHPNAPAPQEVKAGFRVLAKYSGDGNWWPAVIDDVTGHDHIRVTFQGYGNTEIVPREYLQRAKPAAGTEGSQALGGASDVARGAAAGSGGVAASTGAADSVPTAEEEAAEAAQEEKDEKAGLYAGLVIPDTLRLLPTDTAIERERKRKKVKALKLAWKQRKQEEDSAARASNWQSFMHKGGQKRPLGGGGLGANSSIFRTGEGPNARVGVMNGAALVHSYSAAPAVSAGAPSVTEAPLVTPGSRWGPAMTTAHGLQDGMVGAEEAYQRAEKRQRVDGAETS